MTHAPTADEFGAMARAELLAHARRELAERLAESPHAQTLAEAFSDLLFQKQTGIPGILRCALLEG